MKWYQKEPTLQQEKNAAELMRKYWRDRYHGYGHIWDDSFFFPGYYLEQHAGSGGRWYSAFLFTPEEEWVRVHMVVDDRSMHAADLGAVTPTLGTWTVRFRPDFFVAALRHSGPHQARVREIFQSMPPAIQVAVDEALEKEAIRNPMEWEVDDGISRPTHVLRLGGLQYEITDATTSWARVKQFRVGLVFPQRLARAVARATQDAGLHPHDAHSPVNGLGYVALLIPGDAEFLPALHRSLEEAQQAAVRHLLFTIRNMIWANHPWARGLVAELPPAAQVKLDELLMEARGNPKDLKGRHIPEKYLRGLSPAQRKQRIRELTRSRDGEKGYQELPTDRAARRKGLVKKGRYTRAAEERGIEHQGDFEDTARRALRYYGVRATQKRVHTVARELEKVYKKGLAAWQTGGHRPGASQQAWSYARINSLLTGGKTYWTADKKNAAAFPVGLRKAIGEERTWRG